MNIIKLTIENPIKVLVGVLFVLIFGINALLKMPYQLTPNIEYPQITVRTSWAGASPYEMEKEVIDRQERVLKSIPGLIDFESNASNGFGSITLMFDLDIDINNAILLVSNKLNEVKGYPDNIDMPTIRSSNSDNTPVILMAIVTKEGNPKSIDEYGTYFDEIIKPYFERIDGVADISAWGGSPKQVQIQVDPNLLSLYNIDLSTIVSSINQENINVSAGAEDFGSKDYRFRVIAEAKSPEDISELIVISGDNSRVKLGDISVVSYGYGKKNVVVKYGTRDCINMGIILQVGSNVLEMTNNVESVVKKLNKGILNDNGLEIVWVFDQRNYILNAISLVKSNIIIGALLAVIVLLLFLRSLRSTIVIATTIPISIIGTFFIMDFMGRSLNVISLAGIAFAVGMLIDNSIVVLENIDRHINEGKKSFDAAYDGAKEVWGAILASTLTTVAVFLPIVFIKEEAGQLFGDIAIAVSSAVGLSLIVSILVIPVLTKVLYTNSFNNKKLKKVDKLLINFGVKVSDKILYLSKTINSSVKYRVYTILLLTVFSILTVYFTMPKMDYLPIGNKNMVETFITPPPGTSYAERVAVGEYIYKNIQDYIGQSKDGYPPIKTFNYIGGSTRMSVTLTSEDADRVAELQILMNNIIKNIPGITASTSQSPLFSIGRGSGNQFIMNISGAMGFDQLINKVNIIQNKIYEVIQNAQINTKPSSIPKYPEIQFIPDREVLKSSGITASELGLAVDVYLDGKKVGEFKDDTDGNIDIILQGENNRIFENPNDIYTIQINTKNGYAVPISNIAEMKEIMGVDQIRRYNSQRAFRIVVSVQSGMVLEELKDLIMNDVITPLKAEGLIDGIDINIMGASSKLSDAVEALKSNFVLAILITYLLMVALFNNFIYPLIILFTLPFAASGGFVGLGLVNLFIAPQALDVLTMLGFIMLVGIVVNNAILIVHQSLNNLQYGLNGMDAITNSLKSRLRPIFMSTLTSIFGMLPLVLAPGAGSELYRGLGSVILGGLAISTLFTIFVIPALLSFFIGKKEEMRSY